MKLLWFGYLVYSLGNCAMKLCIETGLRLFLFCFFLDLLVTVEFLFYLVININDKLIRFKKIIS